MRKPERSKAKQADAKKFPGGRARKRVEQFAIERGLVVPDIAAKPATETRDQPRRTKGPPPKRTTK